MGNKLPNWNVRLKPVFDVPNTFCQLGTDGVRSVLKTREDETCLIGTWCYRQLFNFFNRYCTVNSSWKIGELHSEFQVNFSTLTL